MFSRADKNYCCDETGIISNSDWFWYLGGQAIPCIVCLLFFRSADIKLCHFNINFAPKKQSLLSFIASFCLVSWNRHFFFSFDFHSFFYLFSFFFKNVLVIDLYYFCQRLVVFMSQFLLVHKKQDKGWCTFLPKGASPAVTSVRQSRLNFGINMPFFKGASPVHHHKKGASPTPKRCITHFCK